jgi:hypothetical protein
MATRAIRLIRSLTLGTEVGLAWFLVFFPFPLIYMCISLFLPVFVFIPIVLLFTSGASSPEWVKPAAEGGGLLVFCFLFFSLAFCVLRFLFYVRICLHSLSLSEILS